MPVSRGNQMAPPRPVILLIMPASDTSPSASPDRLAASARAAFAAAFNGPPDVSARAPGRVELLGNHTDYNGGLVMSAAIDRYTVVAGRAVPGRVARVRSVQFDQDDEFPIDAITPTEPGSWSRYARGVCWALSEQSRKATQPGWPCG